MTQTSGRSWAVLAVASAANFLTILDLWVVSIAYPALERAFAPATRSDVSWILNVYAILLAALLVPAGRIADSYGRRAGFLAGLALFGVASLGCALSPVLDVLIAARGLQAIAAAMLMPTSLGFVLSAFEARDRGMAVGVWAATGAVAASGGPVVGGLLVALSWRWIFIINIPLVLVTLLAGALCLPTGERRIARRVDWLGALLIFGAMGLVCTPLVQAHAWPPSRSVAVFAAGLVLAAVFVAHVRRHPEPVVAPRLFAARAFRIGAVGIFTYYVGFAAMLLGSTLLLTDGWQLSVFHAAIGIAPGPMTASLVSPFSGRLTARAGFRNTILIGSLLFATAAAWALFTAGSSPEYALVLLPSLLLWGLANGLIQPTLFATADAVPGAELALGSAVLTMARQLGSAFGVALLVAVLGTEPSAGLPGLRRAWAVVIVTAVLTGLAGLCARRTDCRSPRSPTPSLCEKGTQ